MQLHKVREYLSIAWVKAIGVTGDCSVCLQIDKLRNMKNKSEDQQKELDRLCKGSVVRDRGT